MYTTTSPEGILNNYANEPAIYPAVYPSPEQQRRYAFQGAIAILLVTATILTAFAVS
ncbi:ssl1498 family light-harvesting-like protein [Pannus brasiliensis CCIBt3594]|uniref:Ssl1498 family light-harvesting-like protein n=1 Tax=Pannus brasiliensis CCIBt3594 TaxID=1427578 RepID=A0AAW9QNV2_9CHRO